MVDSTDRIQIIGLNGSPHRAGSTATLMQWVLEGCAQAGASVEWLHVVDHDIHYCQGCMTCLRTGACPVRDDFPAVRDRLLAADGIVVGSPLYDGQPTALLKNLMDRLSLLHLYTATFVQKRAVGVATSGIAPAMGLAKNLADYFGQRTGAIGAKTAKGTTGYPGLLYLDDPRLPARARAVGRRLVAKARSARQPRQPSLVYLWFSQFLRRLLRTQIINNPEQFAGVIRIWRDKGWLSDDQAGDTL